MLGGCVTSQRELYQFVLSLVILVAGFWLWATRADLAGEVGTVLGTVVGYWFGKVNGNGNGYSLGSGSARSPAGNAKRETRDGSEAT